MADNKSSMVRNIKTGGSMAIYIGTASIIKPYIKQHNQDRNAVTKLCSIVSGTVISCGVSHVASKWFGNIVDKIADFIEDVKTPPKKKENNTNG